MCAPWTSRVPSITWQFARLWPKVAISAKLCFCLSRRLGKCARKQSIARPSHFSGFVGSFGWHERCDLWNDVINRNDCVECHSSARYGHVFLIRSESEPRGARTPAVFLLFATHSFSHRKRFPFFAASRVRGVNWVIHFEMR